MHRLGDLNNAVENYKKALQLDPDNKLAHIDRAVVYRKLANQYPQQKVTYLNNALADLNFILKNNPKLAFAYNHRGLVHQDLSNFKEALDDYKSAFGASPSYVKAYFNAANLLVGQRRFDEAMPILEQGKSNCPKHRKAFEDYISKLSRIPR